MIIAGEIKRLEDWYCKAGPKDKDTQWKDDYSDHSQAGRDQADCGSMCYLKPW